MLLITDDCYFPSLSQTTRTTQILLTKDSDIKLRVPENLRTRTGPRKPSKRRMLYARHVSDSTAAPISDGCPTATIETGPAGETSAEKTDTDSVYARITGGMQAVSEAFYGHY